MKKRIFSAVLAGMTFVGISQAALVAEWNFDFQTFENSGSSGAIHDGTFVTTNSNYFSTDTPTGSGYALRIQSIEDADNVEVPGGDVLLINNSSTTNSGYVPTFDGAAFTVSMWVKSLDATWSKWDELAGKQVENWQSSPNAGWSVRSTAGDTMRFDAYGGGTAESTADALDQTWHLITATYDGATMNLYIDGQPDGTINSPISDASAYALAFGAREDGSRGEDVLIDEIQYYDTALSAVEVDALYITQPAVFLVDSTEIAFGLISPTTMATGSVAISYISSTSVDVAVTISDESHLSAFSLVNTTPMTLTDPSPSNTVLEFAFDNSVTGLIDGESATGLVTIAWNVTGDTEVTEIVLPISATYEVPTPAPILWDFNTTAGGSSSTVADFAAAGVTESLAGATVSNVEGAQNMTDGVITVDLSNYSDNFAPDATYSGAGASIMKDYVYHKGTSVITIGGLSNRLVANTEYSLYLWGKGDGIDQQATFTFEETSITTATNDVFTSDATNFMAKFSFTTDATVPESLEVTWARVATYTGFNGFALLPKYSLNPIVGAISSEIVSGGTEMALSFDTTLGSLYSVEAIDNLVNGTWSDIVTDVEGTDGTVTITNSLVKDAEFYRAYIQD